MHISEKHNIKGKGFLLQTNMKYLHYQVIKVEQHMQTCGKRKLEIFPIFPAKEDNKTIREV